MGRGFKDDSFSSFELNLLHKKPKSLFPLGDFPLGDIPHREIAVIVVPVLRKTPGHIGGEAGHRTKSELILRRGTETVFHVVEDSRLRQHLRPSFRILFLGMKKSAREKALVECWKRETIIHGHITLKKRRAAAPMSKQNQGWFDAGCVNGRSELPIVCSRKVRTKRTRNGDEQGASEEFGLNPEPVSPEVTRPGRNGHSLQCRVKVLRKPDRHGSQRSLGDCRAVAHR